VKWSLAVYYDDPESSWTRVADEWNQEQDERDKRDCTVQRERKRKRENLWQVSTQHACNYRSDRYANRWIITAGARCRIRLEAHSLARTLRNWHSQPRELLMSHLHRQYRSVRFATRKICYAPLLRSRSRDMWKRTSFERYFFLCEKCAFSFRLLT